MTDLIGWLTAKESWGTVPAWFGALSLLLAFRIFLHDRRRRDREQIEKIAVWAVAEYEVIFPPAPSKEIDIRCVVQAKNSGDGVAVIHCVMFEVSTYWSVLDMRQSAPDGSSATVWAGGHGFREDELRFNKIDVVPRRRSPSSDGPPSAWIIRHLARKAASTPRTARRAESCGSSRSMLRVGNGRSGPLRGSLLDECVCTPFGVGIVTRTHGNTRSSSGWPDSVSGGR